MFVIDMRSGIYKRGQKLFDLLKWRYLKIMTKYKVILEESDEGFSVSVPGLPGCHSQGATEQDALENIADAIRAYLEVAAGLTNEEFGKLL